MDICPYCGGDELYDYWYVDDVDMVGCERCGNHWIESEAEAEAETETEADAERFWANESERFWHERRNE
jgi:Zn ribbon nucleic-acid-binding protein